jgi:hypothetical protein
LVTDLLDPFQILRKFPLVFSEIALDLLDEFIEEHLHDCKVILEFLHDFIADTIADEEFVLLFREGLTVDFTLFESDVALVGDHTLPFGED